MALDDNYYAPYHYSKFPKEQRKLSPITDIERFVNQAIKVLKVVVWCDRCNTEQDIFVDLADFDFVDRLALLLSAEGHINSDTEINLDWYCCVCGHHHQIEGNYDADSMD